MSQTRAKRPWPMWGSAYTVEPHTYIDTRPGSRRSSSCTVAGMRCREGAAPLYRSGTMSPNVPEKPSLEGLEKTWDERVGARRDLPFRPVQEPGPDLRHRHPAADGQRFAAHGVGVRVRADRLAGPLPPDAGRGAVLPHGVGRQRAADRAPGRELLRHPLRHLAPLRPVVRATCCARPEAQGGVFAGQLRGAVHLVDRRGRAGLRGAVAPRRPVGRLVADLHDHRRAGPAHQPAGVPPQPGPGRGVSGRGAQLVGRHVPDRGGAGGAGGPARRWRLPPLRVRRYRGAGAGSGMARWSWWTPPGPNSCRRAWHWWPTPTIPATSRCSGRPCARRCSTSRCPVAAHRVGPARQGHRHRHDLYLRRHHRRDVVAGTPAADTGDRRTQRPVASRRPGVDHLVCRAGCVPLAGGVDDPPGPGAHRGDAALGGPFGGRADAGHPSGQVLREGRPAARDRGVASVVHPQWGSRRRVAHGPAGTRQGTAVASELDVPAL